MNALPKVNILIAIKDCFMKYVTLEGRSRRSEYWFFMLLINSITVILLIFLILCLCRIMGVVRIYLITTHITPIITATEVCGQ